jgi:hypothetical protein
LTPTPLIHQTDLFRPHQDPDDHWDLACVYALHLLGRIDLRAIVIDHPPPHHAGRADGEAVNMLNHFSRLDIPYSVGLDQPFGSIGADEQRRAPSPILKLLEASSEPVVINIAGSSRDVAWAFRCHPDLFSERVASVVLNAGTGYASSDIGDEIEYNVKLDVDAYLSMFGLPCPLLWCPCFERLGVGLKQHTHGTHYQFQQKDVLENLPLHLKAYFAYMYSRETSTDWRAWLDRERFDSVLSKQADLMRPMWTTAGLVYVSGLSGDDGFDFEPVSVTGHPAGVTQWIPAAPSARVKKFRILDDELYASSMANHLAHLMRELAERTRP